MVFRGLGLGRRLLKLALGIPDGVGPGGAGAMVAAGGGTAAIGTAAIGRSADALPAHLFQLADGRVGMKARIEQVCVNLCHGN